MIPREILKKIRPRERCPNRSVTGRGERGCPSRRHAASPSAFGVYPFRFVVQPAADKTFSLRNSCFVQEFDTNTVETTKKSFPEAILWDAEGAPQLAEHAQRFAEKTQQVAESAPQFAEATQWFAEGAQLVAETAQRFAEAAKRDAEDAQWHAESTPPFAEAAQRNAEGAGQVAPAVIVFPSRMPDCAAP